MVSPSRINTLITSYDQLTTGSKSYGFADSHQILDFDAQLFVEEATTRASSTAASYTSFLNNQLQIEMSVPIPLGKDVAPSDARATYNELVKEYERDVQAIANSQRDGANPALINQQLLNLQTKFMEDSAPLLPQIAAQERPSVLLNNATALTDGVAAMADGKIPEEGIQLHTTVYAEDGSKHSANITLSKASLQQIMNEVPRGDPRSIGDKLTYQSHLNAKVEKLAREMMSFTGNTIHKQVIQAAPQTDGKTSTKALLSLRNFDDIVATPGRDSVTVPLSTVTQAATLAAIAELTSNNFQINMSAPIPLGENAAPSGARLTYNALHEEFERDGQAIADSQRDGANPALINQQLLALQTKFMEDSAPLLPQIAAQERPSVLLNNATALTDGVAAMADGKIPEEGIQLHTTVYAEDGSTHSANITLSKASLQQIMNEVPRGDPRSIGDKLIYQSHLNAKVEKLAREMMSFTANAVNNDVAQPNVKQQ